VVHAGVLVDGARMNLLVGGVSAAVRKLVLHAVVFRAAADRGKLGVVAKLRGGAPPRFRRTGLVRRDAAVSAPGDQLADVPLVDRSLVVLDPGNVSSEVDVRAGNPGLRAQEVLNVSCAAAAVEVEDLELDSSHAGS
jgi:hypothetical protein